MRTEIKIVSGAQTGVDRGALDAALEAGVPCGGWCPEGRKAEDGMIPDIYPVRVIPGAGYAARTRQNVLDSDATLIIYFNELSGGTKYTLNCCRTENRPYLLINANKDNVDDAVRSLKEFVREHQLAILNVAGPRASNVPSAHGYTQNLMSRLLDSLTGIGAKFEGE